MFAAISATDRKYRDEPLQLRACRLPLREHPDDAGVLKIRNIAIIPTLCRVAGQELVVGCPFGKKSTLFF